MSVFDKLEGEEKNDTSNINRRTFLAGAATAAGTTLAGCAGDAENNETDTEDTPNTETPKITNLRIDGQTPNSTDVDYAATRESAEAAAEQFQFTLNYQLEEVEEAETDVHLKYTDNTVPEEDENIINEIIDTKTVQNGEVTQEVSLPEQYIEQLVTAPRNLQATLTTETANGKEDTQQFQLNYADSAAEYIFEEAFDPQGNIDSSFNEAELQNIDVSDGVIELEYSSDYEIGTEEFNSELLAGSYSGITKNTRTPYDWDITVEDSNGELLEIHIDKDRAEKYLEGEMSQGEFSSDISFNDLYIE